MKQPTATKQSEVFWPRIVIRKWLNISNEESDFSADPDEGDIQSDSDDEEEAGARKKKGEDIDGICSESTPRLRRRNSETLRAQYIDTKEIRICVGTWNAGGKLPPDDLNIDDWLCINEPADIYVLGFQEVVPLNAGNIFGAEDTRPVPKWENVIRETLNQVRPPIKFKSHSDPPTPSKFEPPEDFPDIDDEVLQETDSDENEEEIHPSDDEPLSFDTGENPNSETSQEQEVQRQVSLPKRLSRLGCFRVEESTEISESTSDFQVEESMAISEPAIGLKQGMLSKTLSRSARVGLSWPEPPMNLLPQNFLEKSNSLKKAKSFRATKSLRTYNSFKAPPGNNSKRFEELSFLTDIDLESIIYRKRKSPYVRIISKQMVGIFLSVWVRRCLRRHIRNVKVSTVGVGVMGYIGNKGSISVSMSIYQTLFCFVCTHLTSGEKSGDELKRNADVHEIHRRTHFHPVSGIGLAKNILDHERIIWLGDLNYRINLSYEKVKELISKKELSLLAEKDQLTREFRKGSAFDGWKEGILNFPPTYKYELNSKKYYGEDPKVGRRTPAWCDRILSYGKGMKLLNYKMNEMMLSDHRPVTAIYMAEVEVYSHKKLQRALTITDAELEDGNILHDFDNLDHLDELDVGMSSLMLSEDTHGWQR